MTALAAEAQTREQVDNPWENAQRQFDEAAALLGLDPGLQRCITFLGGKRMQCLSTRVPRSDLGLVRP